MPRHATIHEGLVALRAELRALDARVSRIIDTMQLMPADRLELGQAATNVSELIHSMRTSGVFVSAPTFQSTKPHQQPQDVD